MFYLLALLFAITSCSPRITTDLLRTDEPKGSIDDVELLGEKEPGPADAETPVSGSVQVPAVSGETKQITYTSEAHTYKKKTQLTEDVQ